MEKFDSSNLDQLMEEYADAWAIEVFTRFWSAMSDPHPHEDSYELFMNKYRYEWYEQQLKKDAENKEREGI